MHNFSAHTNSKKKSSSKAKPQPSSSQMHPSKVKIYKQKSKQSNASNAPAKEKLDKAGGDTDACKEVAQDKTTREIQIDIDLTTGNQTSQLRESTESTLHSKGY